MYVYNQNSIHPPQQNCYVLSDRRQLAVGSSTFVEFLFRARRGGGSTKFKKCNSNK